MPLQHRSVLADNKYNSLRQLDKPAKNRRGATN